MNKIIEEVMDELRNKIKKLKYNSLDYPLIKNSRCMKSDKEGFEKCKKEVDKLIKELIKIF